MGQAAGSAQAAADSNESLSSFLVCLVEAPDPPQGAMSETPMALVAVDTSTGSVLYDDFRLAHMRLQHPGCMAAWLQFLRQLRMPHSRDVAASAHCMQPEHGLACTYKASTCHRDGPMRGGLEARLLFVAPSELLVAEPLLSASKRLLGSYASAARRLRSESVPAEKFRRPEALRDLDNFFAAGAALLGTCTAGFRRCAQVFNRPAAAVVKMRLLQPSCGHTQESAAPLLVRR